MKLKNENLFEREKKRIMGFEKVLQKEFKTWNYFFLSLKKVQSYKIENYMILR